MTNDLAEAASTLMPLRIEEVAYNDPMVVIAGPEWSLSVACPWRLVSGGRLVTAYGENGAAEAMQDLVGLRVTDLGSPRPDASGDIQLIVTNGIVLEVFVDTDLDPWVFRLPGQTFVGMFSSQ